VIIDLDTEASLDPGRVGSKAAWLAMGRRAGLPVLPGFVVDALASRDHMRLGATTLPTRGSGGARMSIIQQPLSFSDALVAAGSRLAPIVVARSSTGLESKGEWSGAFTSYLGLSPTEIPQAVAGCWASAFTVAALERQAEAGIEPGSFPMAVLVQRALDPAAGGTARVEDDGTVVVNGVKGSPAPLLQGWSTGFEARLSPQRAKRALAGVQRRGEGGSEDDGRSWVGNDLIDLLDIETLDEIAALIRTAWESLGANRCEWALDGQIWLLQLGVDTLSAPRISASPSPGLVDPDLVRIARVVVMVPDRLGEELVLPWALGGLPATGSNSDEPPPEISALALDLRDELVAEVWSLPPKEALAAARECLTGLLGPDPAAALHRIRRLRPPDPSRSARLLALVDKIRSTERRNVARLGIGRWEPFVASVVLASGTHHRGTVASPGIGAGVRSHIDHPQELGKFSPRAVVTAPRPIPNLAPLLWDAAGLVTETGSPAAHLFDSARALGIPAVSGVELPEVECIVAVDGHAGVVATLSLNGDDDV